MIPKAFYSRWLLSCPVTFADIIFIILSLPTLIRNGPFVIYWIPHACTFDS